MRLKKKKKTVSSPGDPFLEAFGMTALLVGGSILFGFVFGTLYRFLKAGVL